MNLRRTAKQCKLLFMNLNKLKFLIRSDLYRYAGKVSFGLFLKYFFHEPGFKYSFWMRTYAYLKQHKILRYGPSNLVGLIVMRCTYKYGLSVPPTTQIGSGFYIGHFGGIVVNCNSIIGKNCNISHGVTLGRANRGKRKGSPVIGDNVYIGPGAKIVGHVKIGDNVAIGANCVVTKDIPDNAVVVGIPGKIISYGGSLGYVENTDYGELC